MILKSIGSIFVFTNNVDTFIHTNILFLRRRLTANSKCVEIRRTHGNERLFVFDVTAAQIINAINDPKKKTGQAKYLPGVTHPTLYVAWGWGIKEVVDEKAIRDEDDEQIWISEKETELISELLFSKEKIILQGIGKLDIPSSSIKEIAWESFVKAVYIAGDQKQKELKRKVKQ